jgi:CheY-like chemotaxis protein
LEGRNLVQKQILLIDDDPLIVRTLRRSISLRISSDMEFCFHEASSGDEAIEILKELGAQINAVICDNNMSKKSGMDVLREMRHHLKLQIPFCMFSSNLKEADVNVIIRLGGYFIQKCSSRDFERILRFVTKALDIERQSQITLVPQQARTRLAVH